MRDVFEALAWGRGGASCTFHGLFLCELLACFHCSVCFYYLPLFCISRDFAYGLGQGVEGIFLVYRRLAAYSRHGYQNGLEWQHCLRCPTWN
ncbi:hypothetical protein BO85DRAFT_146707 [Aspergillus piperis CBS 112811]|uniref:Uncharacterized protein n=1 Tax=Aspergillus piperis CBS 112811 TaxID=1448313 RepID=A0A8G1QTD7_9EURO|nr:hypothetical protein BO85DRAFT_146707 [Aspergillus piperis CBS 112811]RAH53921.1 hypothetical protein BO85DRAFT_146707 [Aspergillus piperis CBS 112811]